MTTTDKNEHKRSTSSLDNPPFIEKKRRVPQIKLKENNVRQMWITREQLCDLLRYHKMDVVEYILKGRLVALKHKSAAGGLPRTDLFEIVGVAPGAYRSYPVPFLNRKMEDHTIGLDLKMFNGTERRSLANVRDSVSDEKDMINVYMARCPKLSRDELQRRTAPIMLGAAAADEEKE